MMRMHIWWNISMWGLSTEPPYSYNCCSLSLSTYGEQNITICIPTRTNSGTDYRIQCWFPVNVHVMPIPKERIKQWQAFSIFLWAKKEFLNPVQCRALWFEMGTGTRKEQTRFHPVWYDVCKKKTVQIIRLNRFDLIPMQRIRLADAKPIFAVCFFVRLQ